MHYFCLDVGGTQTCGALFATDGTELARARSVGGALSLGSGPAEAAVRDVWQEICQTLGDGAISPGQTKLFAGIAGNTLPGRADELAARLSEFAACTFFGDGYGALLSATGGKPGAMISVGTGVTALHIDENGKTLSLSGWGFPAGDLGSGMWLGLQLTGILTKYFDRVTLSPMPSKALVGDAQQIIGDTAGKIMMWQSGAKPRDFASLAPLIVAHAAKNDPFCRDLLDRAAHEIVVLAQALFRSGSDRTSEQSVCLAGGLNQVFLPLCRAQADAFLWHANAIDPVSGIYLCASGQVGLETLLPRPGLARPEQG